MFMSTKVMRVITSEEEQKVAESYRWKARGGRVNEKRFYIAETEIYKSPGNPYFLMLIFL